MSEESHVDHVETVAEGRWISLQQVHWTDRLGIRRVWERACRTTPNRRREMIRTKEEVTRPQPHVKVPSGVIKPDATSILTLAYHKSRNQYQPNVPLMQRDDIEIILVKQYRPPLCAYSLEFPAGLVDDGENPVKAGIRELKEETGYTAEKIIHQSPQLSLAPGCSTESCVLIVAVVDLDDPKNQNPVQYLDDSEDIEVFHVPLKSLLQEIDKFKELGVIVFEEVYCTALGLLYLPTVNLDW